MQKSGSQISNSREKIANLGCGMRGPKLKNFQSFGRREVESSKQTCREKQISDEQSSNITPMFIASQFCGICSIKKIIILRVFNKLQLLAKSGYKVRQRNHYKNIMFCFVGKAQNGTYMLHPLMTKKLHHVNLW